MSFLCCCIITQVCYNIFPGPNGYQQFSNPRLPHSPHRSCGPSIQPIQAHILPRAVSDLSLTVQNLVLLATKSVGCYVQITYNFATCELSYSLPQH